MTYASDQDEMEVCEEVDVEMLREDLIGELEAINQYEEHIDLLEDEEAKRLLEHISAEEKGHVVELFNVIQRLDSTQAEKFRHSNKRRKILNFLQKNNYLNHLKLNSKKELF